MAAIRFVAEEWLEKNQDEMFHCPHQRHVSVADHLEDILIQPKVPLGDRYHQSKVSANNLVSRGDDILVELLNPRHQRSVGMRGI